MLQGTEYVSTRIVTKNDIDGNPKRLSNAGRLNGGSLTMAVMNGI